MDYSNIPLEKYLISNFKYMKKYSCMYLLSYIDYIIIIIIIIIDENIL